MASLPDDILYMICSQLWERRDFDTLYQCVCAGKQLAVPALTNLYRMHDVAPVTSGGSDEVETSKKEQLTMQWAGLWRTIILSSLGKTLFPYSRYVRRLNLQDLEELLQDRSFRDTISKMFFKNELAVFVVRDEKQTPQKSRGVRYAVLATLNSIGEAVTEQTPMLEELAGYIAPEKLSRWLPRLPRLTHLSLWKGNALAGTGDLFRVHCPQFKTLKFWDWAGIDTDRQFATFLEKIRPQSLESLEIFSYSDVGAESFLALNGHAKSLTELKLNSIKPEAMPMLSKLNDCTNITTLLLTESLNAVTNLVNLHNDVFLEMVSWLTNCKNLRNVTFTSFLNAPALLKPVLMDNDIHLTHLKLEGYAMRGNQEFHKALAHQTSLQSLSLKGEAEEFGSGCGNKILVDSISQLVNLVDLDLKEISDYFRNEHICQLARHLPKLEVWWTSGYGITDVVWDDIASLKSLRRLELSAQTSFTMEGILDFVQKLGPGNKGFLLAVTMADMDSDLSEEEQSLIREMMTEKVEGRFDFTLMRDPEETDFSGESD